MAEHPDDIDGVIQELVDQDALATVTVAEKEKTGRTPTPGELAHPDSGPSVMIDNSLWSDLARPVEVKPQGTALAHGTIPPPLGAYCLLDPAPTTETTTEKIVKLELADDDMLDDVLEDDMIDSGSIDDDQLELEVELDVALDDLDDF